ncbi:hypothetical protein HYC85_023707 [Camellia sinensis]|uniref:Uncharacterized protein n=1 Tax=Camellia sinensis TaxID=4442 RepID=A0A7J7GJ96_CAMSI|nr:hypothetical protein HYC85_023707 [Camellia sinensis]
MSSLLRRFSLQNSIMRFHSLVHCLLETEQLLWASKSQLWQRMRLSLVSLPTFFDTNLPLTTTHSSSEIQNYRLQVQTLTELEVKIYARPKAAAVEKGEDGGRDRIRGGD